MTAVKSLGQDPTDGTWMLNNRDLLKSTLDLFNQNPEIVLDEDKYYEKVLDAKKKGIDIQKAIQEYFNEMNPQPAPQPYGQQP